MKRKICELSGAALNYAVALAEGTLPATFDDWTQTWPHYCASPAGDDIIDREGISVIRCDDHYGRDAQGFTTSERIPVWAAAMGQHSADDVYGSQGDNHGRAYTLDTADVVYGATRREAAMRAWAIYKLSGGRYGGLQLDFEINIPEELCS